MTQASEPKPTLTTTYKRADGHEIAGEYAWVTDIEYVTEEDGYDEPVEIIEETWTRTAVRTFVIYPTLYDCSMSDTDGHECDNDAVGWEQRDGKWITVCEQHRAVNMQSPNESPVG